jgi:histidinol-phosphate aminotransferase
MNFNLDSLIRENIKQLKPYSSARSEFNGEASIFLDANENPFEQEYNRYPDPLQWQVKFALAKIKGVPAENIFLGNGSDEVIDLAFRIFCNPQNDNVIICPPTYGMYTVSANINNVEIKRVNLLPNFQLDVSNILNTINENTKLIFICSPNNPTGNSINRQDVLTLLNNFNGIVVIDEAYINYAKQRSFVAELTTYPNIIVMQTLSKAWGLAALRLGMCFASMDIIDLFNKVKPPYNINLATQQLVLQAFKNVDFVNEQIELTVTERTKLSNALQNLSFVKNIYPSDANFILVEVDDATKMYNYLLQNQIVVRNRTNEPLCNNCLRITVGTAQENEHVINTLNKYTNG